MIQIHTAARVRAQQLARAKVHDAVKRQGVKWSALSAAQKQSWAVLFLEDHPSLIAQARQEVEDSGLAEHPRCNQQSWGNLPLTRRCLGGHNHGARTPNVDGVGWAG